MAPTPNSVNRRSQRLSRGLPVFVCGESPKRKPFKEEAFTVSFNAHGALLVLFAKVELGQQVLLMNPTTWDDQAARVVYSTPANGGLTHIGVEFMSPAPEFWPVSDPPDDWNFAPAAGRDSLSLKTR
ncbi:MAG: hypothetical protein LAO08_10940 [Acidobacteriia bacterium]|nr:hypothetical protein [Terriglobia bacterium]